MDLKMFGDRIVFRPLPESEQPTEKVGSLYIPQSVQDQVKQQRRNYKGKVLIAGDKCEFVKVGTIIAYDEYGVASFFHDGEELLIVREKDLIGMYE